MNDRRLSRKVREQNSAYRLARIAKRANLFEAKFSANFEIISNSDSERFEIETWQTVKGFL